MGLKPVELILIAIIVATPVLVLMLALLWVVPAVRRSSVDRKLKNSSPMESRENQQELASTRTLARRNEPVPYRVLAPVPYRVAEARGVVRPKRRVVHKLYLTAFWTVAVVCGGICLGVALVNLHDYFIVEQDNSCWADTNSIELCNLGRNRWGDPDSNRTWSSSRLDPFAQEDRLWLMLLSPLWLIPLVLLVALRRWVLWLMRSEPGGKGSNG